MREMKDSGVAWIGEIPKEWCVLPNKHLMKKEKNICEKYNGEDILSLSMKGVIVRDLDAGGKMPTTFDGYQYLRKGNLLMCLFDIDVTPRCIGLIKNDGLSSPAYSQFSLSKKANAEYYYYYYLMLDNSKTLYHLAKNLRHSLTEEQLGVIPTIAPPLEDQQKIAAHLDRKCTQIDALIANAEQQITKLKAYKQSVITETVTKGLNPNVPMKDSGVEWIGEIAETHNIWKLKFLLKEPMIYGANESGNSYVENSVRYIRITDITSDSQLKDSEENLYLTEEQSKGYILSDGDILFARSGGTVGKSFIYREKYGKSAFAGYLIKASCDKQKLLPEFLFYYTLSSLYEKWKNMIFIQATIQNIGASKYSNMKIVVMSVNEQQAIVSFLDKKCTQIDKLISIKQHKIDKLQQYKKSIIYEYVTGKKEV